MCVREAYPQRRTAQGSPTGAFRPIVLVAWRYGKGISARRESRRTGAIPPKSLKSYRSLATKKGRRDHHAFLVEGERAVRQVMIADPGAILELLGTEGPPEEFRRFPFRRLDERQLRAVTSMKSPQGWIAVVRIPPDAFSGRVPVSPGERILFLEDVQDPGNVGTLVRTAAAFGYSGVLMSDQCADPYSPKAVQASAGSVLSVWIRRTPDYREAIDRLKTEGFSLIAMDLRGESRLEHAWKGVPSILALGSEASGLSKDILSRADARIRIPVVETGAESLNVAACGAVCMYISRNDDPAGGRGMPHG